MRTPASLVAGLTLMLVLATSGLVSVAVAGNGNPQPGVPHDTIMVHIQPMTGNPNQCNGGHSLHIGAVIEQPGTIVEIPPTTLKITMIDWVQVDNDGDGAFDEDPVDGIDNDGDGLTDEDPDELGKDTAAIDCDSRDGDGEVSIRIRDTDPRKGVISTQTWYVRLVGKPQQNFAFTSQAEHTVECHSTDAGADGIVGTADDTYECTFQQIELGKVDLSNTDANDPSFILACPAGTVKQAGKGQKAGGKTVFCDITTAFLVDVDIEDDGTFDLFDQHIFSVSCEDDPNTTINETLDVCPLGSVIWDVDKNTGRPTIQLFVSHDGTTNITGAKRIRKPE